MGKRVVVFSKETSPTDPERCRACERTKSLFVRDGVAFEVVDLLTDEAARAELAAEGFLQMPVVKVFDTVTGEVLDAWSGLNPFKIKAITTDPEVGRAGVDVLARVA